MFDLKASASGGYRRIEVLTGPGRRRRWSAEDKARVVSESLVAGASPSEIARRWQICTQQLFTWRRQARIGLLTLPSDVAIAVPSESSLVSILADCSPPPSFPTPAPIEVEIAGAVVRVPAGPDAALLTTVLRAVRVSASRK